MKSSNYIPGFRLDVSIKSSRGGYDGWDVVVDVIIITNRNVMLFPQSHGGGLVVVVHVAVFVNGSHQGGRGLNFLVP